MQYCNDILILMRLPSTQWQVQESIWEGARAKTSALICYSTVSVSSSCPHSLSISLSSQSNQDNAASGPHQPLRNLIGTVMPDEGLPVGNTTSRKPIHLDLDEEQLSALLSALQLVTDNRPSLKCLMPVLDTISKAYADVTLSKSRRIIPVSKTLAQNKDQDIQNIWADKTGNCIPLDRCCSSSTGCRF